MKLVFDTRDGLVKFYIPDEVNHQIKDNGDIIAGKSLLTGIPKNSIKIIEANIQEGLNGQYILDEESFSTNPDFEEVEDSEEIIVEKPESVSVDVLTKLKSLAISNGVDVSLFTQYINEFNSLLQQNSVLNALLTKTEVSLDRFTVNWLLQIIENDQAEQTPKLSSELANTLKNLLFTVLIYIK